tara:strand:+ start:12284 stop:13606 length:1323 start_codon:yes stop_codon:yes gene_type:complete
VAITDTAQDLTNFDEALKIRYAKAITQYIERTVALYGMLEKKKQGWTGKHFLVPVNIRTPNTVGARAHSGNLPSGGADVYVDAKIVAKYNYCKVKAFNTAEAHSSGKAGAWATVRKQVLKNAAADLRDSLNRQLNWGSDGILCEANSSGLTVTIKTYGDSIANTTGDAPDTTKLLRVGMRVCWGSYLTAGVLEFAAVSPVAKSFGQVSSITSKTVFVVTNTGGGAAPVAGDVFVIGEGLGIEDHSLTHELTGVSEMIDDSGTFENIASATYPEWKSQMFANPDGAGTERELQEDDITQMLDAISTESTGSASDLLLFGHHSTRRAYANSLKSRNAERFKPTKVKGGYSREYLTFHYDGSDVPLVDDKMAKHRTLFAMSKAHTSIYEVKPFSWDSSSGGTWKWDGSQDAVVAFGKIYCDLGTDNRAAMGAIEDIAVTGITK